MKKFLMQENLKTEKGFTLVEVMVSVMIFSLIMVMGLGALLTSTSAYKETRGKGVVIDNLSFVMESMARKIRTGQKYSCEDLASGASDCFEGGSEEFYFIDQDGRAVAYRFDSDSNGKGYISRSVTGSSPEILTSPEDIDITKLLFYMDGGASQSDKRQPFVTIVIAGNSNVAGVDTDFSLQTSVTQRLLDIPSVVFIP